MTIAAALLSAAGITLGIAVGAANRTPAFAAPAAKDLTVAIQAQRLKQTVPLDCASTAASTLAVHARPPYGGNDAVVTRVVGTTPTSAGGLLIEVAGRPVIALPGRFQAYRDLMVGASGPDVGQLQAGLRAAGLRITDRPGTFGASTDRAVGALYRRLGYTPAEPGEQQASALPATGPSTAISIPAVRGRGSVVPRNEIVYVPLLPVLIDPQSIRVGSEPSDALMTLSSVGRGVTCRVDDATGIREGMTATLDAPGKPITMRVSRLQEANATPDATSGGADNRPIITLAATSNAALVLPSGALQASIVTLQTASEVLTVPISAIGGTPAAPAVGLVSAGNVKAVPVQIGVTVDGNVEVTAVDHGTLSAGQLVTLSPYDR